MLPHRNIHKYAWTFPDGKTQIQIDHILINKRRPSSVLEVRPFRGADCDTDHYLVMAKFSKRLAVNKQAAQKYDVDRLNVRKLSDLEVRKKYQIKISNRFAALANTSDSDDINRAWEITEENVS